MHIRLLIHAFQSIKTHARLGVIVRPLPRYDLCVAGGDWCGRDYGGGVSGVAVGQVLAMHIRWLVHAIKLTHNLGQSYVHSLDMIYDGVSGASGDWCGRDCGGGVSTGAWVTSSNRTLVILRGDSDIYRGCAVGTFKLAGALKYWLDY